MYKAPIGDMSAGCLWGADGNFACKVPGLTAPPTFGPASASDLEAFYAPSAPGASSLTPPMLTKPAVAMKGKPMEGYFNAPPVKKINNPVTTATTPMIKKLGGTR